MGELRPGKGGKINRCSSAAAAACGNYRRHRFVIGSEQEVMERRVGRAAQKIELNSDCYTGRSSLQRNRF